jgi:hypothetical protein
LSAAPARVFVTGMARSGTTLVDKLISLHPAARVLSQPLPLLYVAVKREFLSRTGRLTTLARRYPLADMEWENHYPPAELAGFLDGFHLEEEFCREVLLQQVPYDGQYTKLGDPLALLSAHEPAPLADFVARYVDHSLPRPEVRVRGSKEAICEEFVPYLAGRGVRVILVVRDPRDVLASLDHGAGRRFGGLRKPLLFNLRHWRKSVAVALAHASRPEVTVLRYEDLVGAPAAAVGRLSAFLGLEPLPEQRFREPLVAQDGVVWPGNSSHGRRPTIGDRGAAAARHPLPREEDRFVQAVCYAEMGCLGYRLDIGPEDVPQILDAYLESAPLERPELAAYRWGPRRRAEELARWRALAEEREDAVQFPFTAAFTALSDTVSRARGGRSWHQRL